LGLSDEKTLHPTVEATKVGPSGITVLKESNLRARILLENEKFIERGLVGLADGYLKEYLGTLQCYVRESLVAERKIVKAIVVGQEHKGVVNDHLFDSGVPKWVYQKLSRAKFAETENFDARRILMCSKLRYRTRSQAFGKGPVQRCAP